MAYPPPQRPAQQRPPPVRNYSARPPPQQHPAQDGYGYDQGYDYGYDQQQQHGYAEGYDDGYGYRDDHAPRSYGPPRGQPRPPRGGYGPPMDPRDRNYAYGRPPPDGRRERRPPRDPRDPRDPRRPPRQQPPDRMGWDNPFPNFPPGGQRGPPAPERGMAAMDLNGPGRHPDRPGTASGRRPDPSRGPSSSGSSVKSRGGGAYPPGAGPARSASAGRPGAGPSGRSERSYTGGSSEPPQMPHVSRSATMPVPGGPPMKSSYPGQSAYQDPGYGPRPGTAGGSRSRGGGPPPGPDSGPGHYDADDLVDSYYGSAPDDPDMPNFDAIPNGGKGAPLDEMGLEQPKSRTTPPESGGQYSAYTPQSSSEPRHAQSHPNLRSDAGPNQFANAGFQFDLPAESGPGAAAQAQYGSPDAHQAYDSRGGYPMPQHQGSLRGNGPPQPYRTNNPQYGSEQTTPIAEEPSNPDSLPHHPVPFRPGHDNGAKPVPVRQYSGPTPSNTASPVSPQGHPSDQGPGPITHDELQRLQQLARSKPNDQKTQLLLAQKMVEASTVLVEQAHLDPKSKAKAREKYIIDAHKIVKKLVSAGNSDAQFYLADCYGQGQLGLAVDNKEAFALYHSAAKQGHAQAAYRVAVCSEIGQEEGGGTKRDPFKAVQWYKRAASLGDPPAMYKMGMILVKGLLGQNKNPREGISWLKRAAERADVENPHALHELALMYANAGSNDIVVRDEEYGRQLFHQGAELGYKFSQYRLGAAYEYGLLGCPVDPRQSIIWYTHAAAQGEHQSELALSGWYLTGSEGNLQQSDTEAYLWARKAASAGLSKAEYAMGYFTEVGIGINANLDDAKRWYWRAAAQGFPKARERLEDLKKGGGRMQKTRISRSQKQNEGDCVVM